MTFKEIIELIELLKESNVGEFNIKKNEFELRIKTDKFSKNSNSQPVAAIPQSAPVVPASQPATELSNEASSPTPEASLPPSSKDDENLDNVTTIKSPIVGTFYRSAGPEKPPFVKIGDKIDVGSVVCIVEAMKLFNEIESELAGTVVKVLIEDASPVEYDQPLFLVEV